MRNTKIDIHGTSQKDRIRLYDHLIALGEKIYSETALCDKEYSCIVFQCTSQDEWAGFGSKQKDAISIDEFIEKYPVVPTVTQTPLQSSNYQYKPGDKVKIIPTITKGYSYDVYVDEKMVEKSGEIFTLDYKAGTTSTGKTRWKFKEIFFDWSEDLFELVEQTEQESEKDYAIICKDSSLKDRKLIYLHLESLNYKMYEDTNFITFQNYTTSETVYTYTDSKWQTNHRGNISKHLKVISAKDFIAKFIKTSEQSPPQQDSSVQIGQKYKNSSGTINIITKVTSTQVAYKPENGSREYTCTIANVKKNWKLVTEGEITQTLPTQQIIKKDKYLVGAKVKIREDLRRHHNVNFKMCELAGTIVTITYIGSISTYQFNGSGTYCWTADMFEGEVIEPQIEQQPTTSQEQKFKVNDKVKLKSGLKDGEYYNGITYFDVLKSHVTTGIISKIQKSSAGYQYYIDRIWYGEDTLELDTSTTIAFKYPIGFIFMLNCGQRYRELKVVEVKQDTVRGTSYNLQYVDTGTTTGFVSESFIDNEIATITLATVPTGNATVQIVQDTSVSIKKFDGVTGTPLGGTNQPTIKREKKSMATAIKETAIVTLDQNKQAAIIAGKMEAGRILNKQVIKQIKPHLPIFVKGYLDTPLAPVVVANLVAAIGNHTQNRRVQQVSELMLLAAADTTVQSFNLDKIIDDVLAGVKLPAGILDTDEE